MGFITREREGRRRNAIGIFSRFTNVSSDCLRVQEINTVSRCHSNLWALCEKTYLWAVRNNKGTDQPAHLCSLIRVFVMCLLYPRYEVYRGYIVFAFSVIMFVCLLVCKLFFRQRFLSNYLG